MMLPNTSPENTQANSACRSLLLCTDNKSNASASAQRINVITWRLLSLTDVIIIAQVKYKNVI
jgi:hypothetical protein